MADELRLKTNQRLSLFNKDMGLGAMLALAVPGVGLLLAPIGAIIGGIYGKNRIRDENSVGKVVHKPSVFNKDTLVGALTGLFVGNVVGFVIGIGVKALALTAVGVTAPAAAAVAAVVGVAVTVGFIAVGAKIGAQAGKERMEHEYAEAVSQRAAEISQEKSPGFDTGPSQEPQKSFAAQVEAERARAAQQQR